MNKTLNKILFYILIFLFSVSLILYLVSYIIDRKMEKIALKQSSKLEEVLYYINRNYVDTVNYNQLLEKAISTMLEGLDPHSGYFSAEQNKIQQESLQGSFEGVGIQFNIMNDTVMVINVIAGGPSEKAGIKAGDRIIKVDQNKIVGQGINNEKVFKLLRGKKGTKVDIGIIRPGVPNPLNFKITRDVIETFSVDISYMISKGTGYIKINQFGETTYDEFTKALNQLKNQGMKKLIIDLQGNAGGYLDAAIRICDHFLKKGEMILYTEGEHTKSEKIYATSKGDFENGEVVVLIDEFSASASEIVAGAIQDNDRGTIVGRRSFGKGLVQQMIPLNDGSSLRLTIARYHTPSGRCIQRDYKEGVDAYYQDFAKRFNDGELMSADSAKFDPKLKYKTKNGRTVYGGGGIMPDVFVPLDQSKYSDAYVQLINSGLLIEYCFNFATQQKNQITKSYKTANQYVDQFTLTDDILNQYIQFYSKKGNVKLGTLNSFEKSKIKIWLKALIGRNIYRDEAFYPVLNKEDAIIQKALKLK